jgi:penicillin amidase
MTPFLVLLLGVAALVVIGSAFAFFIYWRLVQRPTPNLNSNFELPGLQAAVEVLRDKHGIPHIYAEHETDLLMAQGFIHAQDRLWQMEQNRRVAWGRLAEVFGESALDVDRFARTVGFWRAAQVESAALDPETRRSLEAYVAGINAFIAQHPGRLGAEFNLLQVVPDVWQVEDVVAYGKLIGWTMGLNWEAELLRLQLVARMDPIHAAELEPDYPHINPIILDAVGSEAGTRLLATAGLLLNEYDKVRMWLGQPAAGIGSNSWAIAPKHTQSRRAILCNDPHLMVQMPSALYENALHAPTLQAAGASFPGLPGVAIGHNTEIAWGLTTAYVDQQDIYLERFDPDDPLRYAVGESWENATRLEEEIRVRGRAEAHLETVLMTRHGPVLSTLVDVAVSGPLVPALQWTGLLPGHGLRALLALNRAQDWTEFQAALADWSVPAVNVTYADADGNIGYLLAGSVPVRRHNLGLVPAPGWDDAHEWAGMVPSEELPQRFNPPSGKLVTANHKIAGDEYHHFLGADFVPGWRAARIEEMLNEKERFGLKDMEEMQLDVNSKFAAVLTPLLAQLNSDDPFVSVAIGHLRRWNYRVEVDSTAAIIVHYTLISLLDEIFGKRLGDLRDPFLGMTGSALFVHNGLGLRAAARLLELVGNHVESSWYTDVESGRLRARDEILYLGLAQAVKLIRAELGDNARRWNWGRVHQVRYAHPLGSLRLFRSLFNRGPFPVGGDATTVNQTYHAPQLPLGMVQVTAGYRQIYEVGNWDKAVSVTTSGQSGHPMSEHYVDQMTMWREGVYHAMPWSRAAVDAATRYRAVLRPPAS